ncbi:MAG: hypothetical protein KJ042_18185 [Deltaproteobacteria bacterium]|nr:hypothetical protein [Deltaproteobacteria bacterium]
MRSAFLTGFLAILALGLAGLFVGACAGGSGGDDDDEKEPTYGEEIEGVYPAVMTIVKDDCTPDNEGESEDWIVEIEQSDDLGTAWVRYTTPGSGLDAVELFKSDVYGTVVVKAAIESFPAGNGCTKFNVQNYRVKIDSETLTISGALSDDIFYQGAGCDSSSRDCTFERTIEPGSVGD